MMEARTEKNLKRQVAFRYPRFFSSWVLIPLRVCGTKKANLDGTSLIKSGRGNRPHDAAATGLRVRC